MKIIALAALFASSFAFAQAKNWEVDSGHASIVFKINHLGFSNVYGTVSGLEGKIVLDEAKPEKSSFDLKAPASNVHTNNVKRDEHLQSPDFFNVKQFANIELKSKSVKKVGENYDVTADLTMHGVTKPVSFVFHRMKTGKDPWGNTRTGGETAFKIKRSDFGMNFMAGAIGDEVDMMVSLEAVQK